MKSYTRSCVALLMLCASMTQAHAAQHIDGAVIRNSGSTNSAGYVIKVWSNGQARFNESTRGGVPIGTPATGRIPAALAQKFFAEVKAAKTSSHVIGESCMKSASFGTTTVVQYHGWTSPDLECPGDGFVVSLGSQAHAIAAALNLPKSRSRRTLLPNEPRRAPETSSGQASPTPEYRSPVP